MKTLQPIVLPEITFCPPEFSSSICNGLGGVYGQSFKEFISDASPGSWVAWRYLPNQNADIKSGFPLEKDQTVSVVFGEFIAASYIAGINTGFHAFGTEVLLT